MKALGQVIRASRGEMSQNELGNQMGVPQTTISRWEMGQVDLTMEQVRSLEVALRIRPGTLAISSGYSEPEFTTRDVEMALRADPALHPDMRGDVVRAYRSYVEMSRRLSEAERVASNVTPTRRKRSAS